MDSIHTTMINILKFKTHPSIILFILVIYGCGSGGENKTSIANNARQTTDWIENYFLPELTYKNKCLNPRSGVNPETSSSYLDIKGTSLDENNYLRSYTNNTYLWYDEVVDRDPSLYSTESYFDLLKTSHDRFHFTYPTTEWIQLSQSGISAGYGVSWINQSNKIRVAYTEPNTPASSETVGLERGDEIIEVDGIKVTENIGSNFVNNILYPDTSGKTHTFLVKKRASGETTEISMTSDNIVSTPVQEIKIFERDSGKVGYFLFNDHIATSESGLFDAITQLKSNNIKNLVLDVRYNGGGYLAIANQLTYMIAGPILTAGINFETMVFNDKHPNTNPVTGSPITPIPFYATTIGLSSMQKNIDLPFLDLSTGDSGYPKVFVITGNDTCSASESIINSLMGLNIEVIQIGSVTCGKPYGFYPTDNCGTTYFTVQFKGINAKGYGDYGNGFKPRLIASDINMPKGCLINDDLDSNLGSTDEDRLSAALYYLDNGNCPIENIGRSPSKSIANSASTDRISVKKNIFLTNRIFH